MLLKIYETGQPVLRRKARLIAKADIKSAATQTLIDSMIETLRDVPAVGLAAPQVGQSLQLIVIEDKAAYQQQLPAELLAEQHRKAVRLKVFINPKLEILESSDNLYFEGCLSVDGYMGAVCRAHKVRISALDRTGKPVTQIATGWYARILQHEVGHLNGELYIDHVMPKSFISIKNFTKFWRGVSQAKIRKTFLL